MPDYSKSKIYKIYSYENDDVYYGSTVETLSRRMTGHRTNYKRYKEGKSNNNYTSFKILELTSAKIELVENFPCSSKEELLQREGFYIRNNNCVNKVIPDRTHKEYNKQYCELNKEKIKEYQKEYFDLNIDKFKEQRKEWVKNNKDKYNQYQKEYQRVRRQQKKEQELMFSEDTNINEF